MWSYLFLLVCFVSLARGQELGPVLSINQGNIVGAIADDGDYWTFLGIPYAESADGENRFQAPKPPREFDDIFFANKKSTRCVHLTDNGFDGHEDCLKLDIYTPGLGDDKKYPVMIVAQGNELDQRISTEYSFMSLVEHDVVVVNLNYRTSVLGFLCLGIEEAQGNAGLKDIIAGLKWVQENIAKFGGSPESVTLFGHGPSAAAVDLISLSPQSAGLFHKIITQSGNAIAPWAVKADSKVNARLLVENLGHDVSSEEDILSILKRTSVSAMMGVLKNFDLRDNSLDFAPCIEIANNNDEYHVITESPVEQLQHGKFNAVPYLTGFVADEGSIRELKANQWLRKMDNNFEEFLPPNLEFQDFNERLRTADNIRSFYFQAKAIDSYTLNDYINYHGDSMILVPTIRNAWLRASTSEKSVFLYQFSYSGEFGKSAVSREDAQNTVAHGEELGYIFDYKMSSSPKTQDLFTKNIMIERWANFVKTGLPTSSLEQAATWLPVEFDTIKYLHIINSNPSDTLPIELALVNPQSKKISFWDQIYDNYYRSLTPSSILELRNDEEEDDLNNGTGSGTEFEDSDGSDTPMTVDVADLPGGEESSAEKHIAALFIILSMIAVNLIQY